MKAFDYNIIDWCVPIVVAILSLTVGRRFRATNLKSYLVAGRSVPAYIFAASLTAGVYGGGFLLAVSELVSKFGIAALSIVVGLAGGALLSVFVIVPHKRRMDKLNVSTIAEFFGHNWGELAQRMVRIVVLLWAGSLIVMQLIAAGQLTAMASGINPAIGILISVIIVLGYGVRGGLRSVIMTDLVQLVIVMIVAGVALAGVCNDVQWSPIHLTPIADSAEMAVVGLIAMGVMNMVAGADLWQRMFAARSSRDARLGFSIAAVLIFLLGTVLVIIALAGRVDKPSLPSAQVMIWGLFKFVPRPIHGIVLAFLLVLVLSTLDTMACIVGVSAAKDFRSSQTETQGRRRAGIATALVLVVASVFAVFFNNILSWAVGFSYLGLVLGPSVLLSRGRWKLSILAANLSIGVGIGTAIILVISGSVDPQNAPYVLAGSMAGAVFGSALNSFISRRDACPPDSDDVGEN